MTEIIGRDILFDLAGGYKSSLSGEGSTPRYDELSLQSTIEKMVNDRILEEVKRDVTAQIVGQVKRDITTELTTDIRTSFGSFTNMINGIRRDVEEFKAAIKVTKNYVSFTKRRLVSVAEGKDEADVVTKKQLYQELAKLHK